ncbi:MAG: hypothetical protein AABY07_09515 [Nanoarchaeota archaeon]
MKKKKTTTYILVVLIVLILIFLFSKRAPQPSIQETPVVTSEAKQTVNQGLEEVESGLTETEEAEQDIDISDLEGLEEDLNIDI